jgi:hypothetical protein
MADQTIPDLPLISAVTDGVNFPNDDSLQSYRCTAAQLKAYILANQSVLLAMLKDDIFTGLTEVTPADDDYFPLVDTSDSNKTKKGLVGSFRKAVYRSVTTTDSVTATDETMKLSGASFTSTLPTAVGVAGKRYKYIHAGTSATQVYTIGTTSGQTIGGIAGGSYALYTNGEVLEIESDGANWVIVGRRTETAWINAGTITVHATTTNPTKGSTQTVDAVLWKRMGDSAHIRMYFRQTSASGSAAGSGDYKFLIPTSIGTIDTAKCQAYATVEGWGSYYANGFAVGRFDNGNGSVDLTGLVVVFDSSYVRCFSREVSANVGAVGSAGYGLTDANVFYSLDFIVPISGWQP